MRREVIVRAAEQLARDIVDAGIDTMVDELFESARGHSPKSSDSFFISLSVLQKYFVLVSKYGEPELVVADIIGLGSLLKSATWQELAEAPNPGNIFELRGSIRFALKYLPRVAELLRQDHVQEAKAGGQLPPELKGRSALTLVLPEDSHEYSSPARLITALDAMSNIYSVFAELEKDSGSDLIVLACDSGSDKSFDFLGLAKIMEEVRKFILAIWDRRVFYRHMHASQCIALIAESLPVIERIDILKRQGALGPEEAELLKRKALTGATQFLESGIFVDEMEREGYHSPRQLMRPEPKLLAGPVPTAASSQPSQGEQHKAGTPRSAGALSADEIATLKGLLERATPSSSPTSPQSATPRQRKPRSAA
jgi:hypothetical protein